jgi:putative spermidine/putrescine transport system permease protein
MTRVKHLSSGLISTLVMAYLLFPVLVVVVISFSSLNFLRFPPPAYSLRWYERLWNDWAWSEALLLTLQVGGLTTIFATLLGVPAAFALARLTIPGKSAIDAFLLAALITPPIIKAISFYLFYVPYGLINTVIGLAAAHTVSAMPYVVINVRASLKSFDPALERAAIIHGASPLAAVLRITLPVIAPSIFVGAIFAFLTSAQELLVAMFVMGTSRKPFAVKLWEGVTEAVTPQIAAASTALILMTLFAFTLAAIAQRRRRQASAA